MARELGIDRSFANTLPEGKAGIVEQLAATGATVCFSATGSTTRSLKKANVSVSLRGARRSPSTRPRSS